MAAWPPAELFFRQNEALGVAALFVLMLWSLANCFLGYVIFRLALAVTGMLAGAFVGAAVVSWRIASPAGLDYFLGCVVASGLLGLGGWFLYRTAFALAVAAAAAVLIATSASPASLGWWVFGGIVGLPLGVAAFVYLRTVFILLSAVGGGLGVVFYAGSIISGGVDGFVAATIGPGAPAWLTVLIAVLALALAGAGAYCQVRLLRIVRTSLTPETAAKRKRPSRSGRGPGLLDRSGRLSRSDPPQ